MHRFGSFWVLYQSVIALPAVLELMNFHFDFYTFVDSFNHAPKLRLSASDSK